MSVIAKVFTPDKKICFFYFKNKQPLADNNLIVFKNPNQAREFGSAVAVRVFQLSELFGGSLVESVGLSSEEFDGERCDFLAIKLKKEWEESGTDLKETVRQKLETLVYIEQAHILPYRGMTRSTLTFQLLEKTIQAVRPQTMQQHGGDVKLEEYKPDKGEVHIQFLETCGIDINSLPDTTCNEISRICTYRSIESGIRNAFPELDLTVVPPEDVAKLLNPTRSPG